MANLKGSFSNDYDERLEHPQPWCRSMPFSPQMDLCHPMLNRQSLRAALSSSIRW